MSLSHLLNDPSPDTNGDTGGWAPPKQVDPVQFGQSKQPQPQQPQDHSNGRKRTSYVPAFVDDPADSVPTRRTRGRRYEEEDDDYEEPKHSNPSSFSRATPTQFHAALSNGHAPSTSTVEEQDDAPLMNATRHIWQGPLESFIDATRTKRVQFEQDFVINEARKQRELAVNLHDTAVRKMQAMRDLKEARLAAAKASREVRKPSVSATPDIPDSDHLPPSAPADEQTVKDQKREERLRKQREAAKRRRAEDKARRQRDDDSRRSRAEDTRLAKVVEAERRAALTPEEREAEDQAMAEEDRRFQEETAARMRELDAEEAMFATGRGARKRQKQTGFYDDTINWDDLDDEVFGGKPRNKSSRRSSPTPADSPYNSAPPGAYLGPDGVMYNPDGEPVVAGQAAYDSDSGMSVDGEAGPSKKLKPKKSVAELERQVWAHIARREIPKINRAVQQSLTSRQFFCKRVATVVSREARRSNTKVRSSKDVQTRAKRIMREVTTYLRGNEKRERESRKKAEKEAFDKARREEEVLEAKRQARKLNFLITQTELYSHFVGNKIKTSEAEESADTASDARLAPPQQSESLQAALATTPASEAEMKALDFDQDDEAAIVQHARRNAEAAVSAAKNAADMFDKDAAAARVAAGGTAPQPAAPSSLNLDGDELNFQNPSLMAGEIEVEQPKMLTCQLKEYQLKGLKWLANLYEQGINGILADEMGLGKTVQSISLMAYLAEKHDIWGPFLVIAPASTLHNWQQEITRFAPALKALPYWGSTKDRAVLRKFWNRKSIRYDRNAPYHIVVTSYQLAVQDEKYFQALRWQYMILDEAQAIKSSSSTRWQTLLGFRCRNRLLLTGTPIQNSMHELWALLHFIMPSLFDSHDEFSDWFSKDIESSAETKGAMNEHQLRRLHMILKPFMLRRIKKNVQNELSDKIEIDVFCELTSRQRTMYRTLKENISITDLVARATSLNDDDSVKRLMNLIMQFRKVCNHPELFERADVTAPLAFSAYSRTGSTIRPNEVLEVAYAVKSNIEFHVPKLLYREGGMIDVPSEQSRAGSDTLYLQRLMNIWTPDYIQRSIKENDSAFSWSRGLGLSPSELSSGVKDHGIRRLGQSLNREAITYRKTEAELLDGESFANGLRLGFVSKSKMLPRNSVWRELGLVSFDGIEQEQRLHSRLVRTDTRFYMDKAVAPAIDAVCSDRSFAWDQERERFDPLFSAALYGVAPSSEKHEADVERFESNLPGLPAQGVLRCSTAAQLPFPPMQVPQLGKLILDSGKLAKLDGLLKELKAGGHRVLVYFQMTKMIDLMEEYLAFRQYKYLRLDGSTTISDRRDMVMDWQTRPDLFIFLLSTRAGGLGINLTAADTVIFYDSDWNPSNDAQAMDRAHRLGQTKQVTVYRFITKGTVDERIVQLARNKKLVQDAVVGSSSVAADQSTKPSEVVSLLLDDRELEESLQAAQSKRRRLEENRQTFGERGVKAREQYRAQRQAAAGESKLSAQPSWDVGGDDDEDALSFFANTNGPAGAADDDDMGMGGGGGGSAGPAKGGSPKKGARKRPSEVGADAQPKPKKKRRTKAEIEAAKAAGE